MYLCMYVCVAIYVCMCVSRSYVTHNYPAFICDTPLAAYIGVAHIWTRHTHIYVTPTPSLRVCHGRHMTVTPTHTCVATHGIHKCILMWYPPIYVSLLVWHGTHINTTPSKTYDPHSYIKRYVWVMVHIWTWHPLIYVLLLTADKYVYQCDTHLYKWHPLTY